MIDWPVAVHVPVAPVDSVPVLWSSALARCATRSAGTGCRHWDAVRELILTEATATWSLCQQAGFGPVIQYQGTGIYLSFILGSLMSGQMESWQCLPEKQKTKTPRC